MNTPKKPETKDEKCKSGEPKIQETKQNPDQLNDADLNGLSGGEGMTDGKLKP